MNLNFTDDVNQIVDYAVTYPDQAQMHIDKWTGWVGRNKQPELVFRVQDYLTPPQLLHHLIEAWSAAEMPEDEIPTWEWIEQFRELGFSIDGVEAELPKSSVVLYRGAAENHVRGMSWTTDRDVAQTFATGLWNRRASQVWKTEAEPAAILAQVNGREEHEWMLDPAMIGDVELVGQAAVPEAL